MKLLKTLCEVHAPSGEEFRMKAFLLNYIDKHAKHWKVKPFVMHGAQYQDNVILVFGKPRVAVFAHMDSVGFTVRYNDQLLPIGSPDAEEGTLLVGEDSKGPIVCTLRYDKEHHACYTFDRIIDRGTTLTYQVDYKATGQYIQSAYLDNRLGVYVCLRLAEELEDGVIAFTSWEEHGGGSVPYLASEIYSKWGVRQALVSDITWTSDGVHAGEGVAISMRDRNIPRRQYVEKIISIAKKRKIDFQLEVEGMGSSDGRELQTSPYPFDWCFVGAPQHGSHTPKERVHKKDVESMLTFYKYLMNDI